MKILIIGGGGREHALAWRLKKSPAVTQIIASPGNPGIAQIAKCVPGTNYVDIAQANQVDFTIVGPEAPLVAGIVDEFHSRGLKIIGPTQAAAQLEGSKIFAKRFFERAAIPTAKSIQVNSYNEALDAIKQFALPVVIKADGLHAGKGVVIAQTTAEANDAVQALGPALVIEEFLTGEEVSYIVLTDGDLFFPFPPAQDHKRAFDNDIGPNTGGMGAYTDPRILTLNQMSEIDERIILPTLRQMRSEGTPFTGFLYAGIIMTAAGPKILEYNVRMGDPETQAIMHAFDGDLLDLLMPSVDQGKGGGCFMSSISKASVCITLAAQNYPGTPRTGDLITGIEEAEATGAIVFQAGTKMVDGKLYTNGGRVLSVTAGADTLSDAIRNAYAAVAKIHFDGMHYRTDIGQKGLKRW